MLIVIRKMLTKLSNRKGREFDATMVKKTEIPRDMPAALIASLLESIIGSP